MKNRKMMMMVDFIKNMLDDLVELETQALEDAAEFIEFCHEDGEYVDEDLVLEGAYAEIRENTFFAWNRAIERGISEEILEAWFDREGFTI